MFEKENAKHKIEVKLDNLWHVNHVSESKLAFNKI